MNEHVGQPVAQPGGPRFLVDSYLDWVAAEGVPVVEDFCVDLNRSGGLPHHPLS